MNTFEAGFLVLILLATIWAIIQGIVELIFYIKWNTWPTIKSDVKKKSIESLALVLVLVIIVAVFGLLSFVAGSAFELIMETIK